MGYFFALLYSLITASSMLLSHHEDQNLNPGFVLLVTFSISIVGFNLLHSKKLPDLWRSTLSHWRNFLSINMSSALCWVATFWSLRFIPASLFLLIALGLMPMALQLVQSKSQPTPSKASSFVSCVGQSLIVLATVGYYFSTSTPPFKYTLLFGSLLACLACVAGAYYLQQSKKWCAAAKLSTMDLMCQRFYGTWLTACVMVIWQGPLTLTSATTPWLSLLVLALITVMIPLFFLQRAITLIGPKNTASVLPLTPMIAFIIHSLMTQHINPVQAISTTMMAVLMLAICTNTKKIEHLYNCMFSKSLKLSYDKQST